MSGGPPDADLSPALRALATTVIEDEGAIESEAELIRVALADEFDLEAVSEDGPGDVDPPVRAVLESAAERAGHESVETYASDVLTEAGATE